MATVNFFKCSAKTKLLLHSDAWTLTYQDKSRTFEPDEHSCRTTDWSEQVGFFDLKNISVIYIEDHKDRSLSYYQARPDRYCPMPTHEDAADYSDLRDFVSSQPNVPAEVIDAVWSIQPFRNFKEVASAELLNDWSEYEDHLDRHRLLDFFKEHGVKVDAVNEEE